MDKDVEKKFEALFELFSSDGWKEFVARCKEDSEALQHSYDLMDSPIALGRAQGQRLVYNKIISLEQHTRDLFEEVKDQ